MQRISKEAVDVAKTRDANGLARFYELIFPEWGLPTHLFPVMEALADDRINKLMLIVGPGSGKSQGISILYPTWVLGHDPTQTILNIGAAEDLTQGFVQGAGEIIEHNPAYKAIFPRTKPSKEIGWSKGAGLNVTGRMPGIPDPSYCGYGIFSSALTGKHGRTIILDDPHNAQNSQTPEQIEKVVNLYYNNIVGRQDPKGARFIIAGRRWAENDLYGSLMASDEYVVLQLPALQHVNDYLSYNLYVPKGLDCVFSETSGKCGWQKWIYDVAMPDSVGDSFYWPSMKMKEAEVRMVRRNSPAIFSAVYQGDPIASEGRVFDEEDFRYMDFTDSFVDSMRTNGGIVIQSWDTAFSKNSEADFSVGITLLLVPCDEWHRGEDEEQKENHWDVYVVDAYRGKLDFAELVPKVRDYSRQWRPEFVLMEKKATGTPLMSLLKAEVPLVAVDPGSLSKRARAVNGANTGSAQGWFRLGRVIFRKGAPWLDALKTEIVAFTGKTGETDDQVDALVYAINYAIDLTKGEGALPTNAEDMMHNVKVESIESNPMFQDQLRNMFEMDMVNPFDGNCATCVYFKNQKFCGLHNNATNALNGCDFWSDGFSASDIWL